MKGKVCGDFCEFTLDKGHFITGEQMDTAQRIRLIRMIEKIEKNPEFSSKIGVRNTSEFISSKQSKK